MANPFAKAWWNAQDAFKANTDRDKKKRQEAGQPILYQDQQRMAPVQRPVQVNRPTFKPLDNSLTRGLSRGFDQVNMFDNNRTWQQTAPTNQRSVGGIFGAVPKSIVKPFVETGDIVKSGTQLGIANFTGNKQAADNARLNRDTSYQESMFAPAISRTYTRLSEVPVIGDTLAPGKRQANKIIERKLQDTQKLTDIAVDSKVKEISNGIKSGKYDRNKGNQAIQQILEQGKVPTQALDQFYNQRLQSAGFDKNMSAGRIGASTAGDLATVASLAIAPASGASLAKLPIRQAVKTGTTDVLTNSVLGATGTGATAYGQGASLQDSLKAASSGALINTALLGAGYIKPALTGITGKTNRVVTPKNINTSRIAPDKIRVLSELHDSLLPDSKITRTTEMVKTAQEIAKKTGNKDLINAAPEARRAAILDTIDAYEVARGSVSDLSKPRFISSQPVTNTVGAAAERRMVRDNIQSRPIINGSALSGEGAQLPGPRLPKEVQQNLMTKARAKLGIKPMDEVGGAKIGDIPGLNKVAKDPLDSLKQEARKYKSAEEFVKAQTNLYHGTKADFSEFDPNLLGTNTGAPSAKKGFFFTDNEQLANHYANPGRNQGTAISKNLEDAMGRAVERAKKEGLDNSLSNNTGGAMVVGSWPKTAKATEVKSSILSKMETLKSRFDSPEDIKKINRFQQLVTEELDNTKLTDLELSGKVLKSKVNLENPMVFDDNGLRNGASYAKRIDEAIAKGHDGVIIKNTQDPFRGDIHVAFDKNQILTEKQLTDLYNQANKPKVGNTDPLDSLKQEAKLFGDTNLIKTSEDVQKLKDRINETYKGKEVPDEVFNEFRRIKELVKENEFVSQYGSKPKNIFDVADNLFENVKESTWKKTQKIRDDKIGGIYAVDGDGPLYRSVTVDDWERIQKQGFIDTDGRATFSDEGDAINLANDPKTSLAYIPENSRAVVLEIDPKNLDLYGIENDSYLRTSKIPLENIKNTSPIIGKSKNNGTGTQYYLPQSEPTDLYNQATKSKKLFKSLDQEGKVPMDSPLLPLNRAVSKKQSKFAKTIAKSDEISPELQSSVKKANPEYIPLENAEMAKVSKKFVNKGYKKASVEVTSRLETKLGKINGQDVADTIHVIKELDKRGGIENLQKATDLSEKLSQHLTKAGQTIQASSILNNRTPAGMMYGARKFLKNNGIDVTPEIQKLIKSKVDEIAKLPKGEDRLYKIAELQQSISQLVPSTNLDKAIGLWKAGLLTGIKTQTGNTLSGVATNIIKTASDAPAALLDTGFSALGKTKVGKKLGFQGQRAKVFTLRGKGSGAVEGAQKGWKSLKTGIDERNMEASKFDTKRLVFSNKPAGKIAQKYTDTVYGLMGAADRPNYYSNLRNNLYDLAIVDAKNKNLTGALKEAHIKKFVKEPPMSALETANKAAETAIFANDTALSRIAGGVIKKAEDAGPGVGAAAKIAMPFTKVPSSVATRLIDYSPFGAVKTVVSQIQNVKKGGVLDQRALSEGLAQSGVGTGTMFLGMKLKEADLMTGSYPTDEKERELWKLEGKQENSVKVGGKWLSFNYTSPVGQILAIGGKVQEAKEKGQGIGGQIVTGAAAIPKTVNDQSFLQGISGVQDAINDPERSAAKYARSQAASIIPTLSNDIGKATDPLQRQSNNPQEAIKARIPGLNRTLLPKQDSFGAPLPRASSSVDTLLNPFRPSNVRETNPLNSELRRLQDAQFGVMPSTNDKQLKFGSKEKGTEQTINLTPQQLYDKNNKTGQQVQKIWNDIIKSPEYQKMDDYEKQKTLRNALSDVNAVTRNQFAAKNKPELLDLQKLSKDQTKLAQGNTPNYSEKTMKSSSKSDSSDTDTYEYRKTSSQNSLDMSRATNNNNLDMYLKSANNELEALEKLKKQYDPKTEQDKINNITKKQEALQNKAQKFVNQGYIKKGKKTSTKKGRKGKKGGSYSAKSLLVGSTSGTRSLLRNAKVTYKKRKK